MPEASASVIRVVFPEDFQSLAYELLGIIMSEGFGERPQSGSPLFDHVTVQVVGHPCGSCIGALRVGKNVEVAQAQGFDQVDGCGKIFLGFAGESRDDIGTDTGMGKMLAKSVDGVRIASGIVGSAHQLQDAIGSRLEWEVHVIAD